MKGLFEKLPSLLLSAGLALLAPLPVVAQAESSDNAVVEENTAVSGTVQGIVANVNYRNGFLAIRSGYDTVTLRGTPSQLSGMMIGDNVSLHFDSYANRNWISTRGGLGIGGTGDLSGFAQSGKVTGVVTGVDKADGIVALSGGFGTGVRLRAHPEVIGDLIPGQYINFSYVNVQGIDWLTAISPGAGTSGTTSSGSSESSSSESSSSKSSSSQSGTGGSGSSDSSDQLQTPTSAESNPNVAP